jgi:hypothetical protein
MEPSSLIKVTGAFAAGVVLALGGALVYIKTAAVPAHSAPPLVIQPTRNPPPATHVLAPPIQEVETKPPVIVHRVQRVRPKPAVAHDPPTVVQVAQAIPPAIPPPAPVLPMRPAVNESQSPMGPQLGTPAQTDPPPPPAPHVVTLQSGTNLVVRLGETVSTEHNYTGDTFRGTLDVPLVIDGFIIADKGSKVLGKVASAQKAGRVEGAAELQLTIVEINTTDGQRIPVETGFFEKRASGRGGEEAAKIGGGAALGAIIGAIAGGGKGAAIGAGVGGGAGTGAVLLTHGKPALLPAETRLTFQLNRPATITEKLNQ